MKIIWSTFLYEAIRNVYKKGLWCYNIFGFTNLIYFNQIFAHSYKSLGGAVTPPILLYDGHAVNLW